MRWILLALFLFVAADVSLLYLAYRYGGVEALLAVCLLPWLFRATLIDWARNRAAASPGDSFAPDPLKELSRIGDQFMLTLASAGLFLPGVLLRIVALGLLSRRIRARLKSFVGRKATAFSPASLNAGFPGSVVFTQVYGGTGFPGMAPDTGDDALKRADGREVDDDFSALPDGEVSPAANGTPRS